MTQKSYLAQNYARSPIEFVKGEGAYLIDSTGREYLDFGSGIAVNALGHHHPYLINAMQEAIQRPWHLSNIFTIPEQEKLGKRLCETSFADRAFFCNSGAEALEASFKMARRYHYLQGNQHKYRIITLTGAFHGRTLATTAATGNANYLEGFGPKVEGFDQVAFMNLNEMRSAIGDDTAAILIEPVQGEGGFRVADDAYLTAIRQICDEYNLLLIYDEVQCGNGRTGKYWAYEWSGVAPDILATAKGLGGGFPIGAVLAKEEVAAALTPGSHGTTFGGNPLAMAIGNAVLDIIQDPGFMEKVNHTALILDKKLRDLQTQYPDKIIELRGRGLMRGLVLVETMVARDQVAILRDHGLLTVASGQSVIRLLPPLMIDESHIDQAFSILATLF